MDKITEIIWVPASELFKGAYVFAGKVVAAVIIFIIGWLVAKAIKQVIVKVLKLLKLDVGSEKVGIEGILAKGEIKYTLSELIGIIVYWIIMLGVLAGVVKYLGWVAIADLLQQLVVYLPNVLASIFVLILGIFFATFISSIVRAATSNAGIAQAKTLGNISQIIILIFAVVIAIQQLKIDASGVLVYALNITLAAIGLAFAIAVGLGSKDIAGELISKLLDKIKKR